MRFHKKNKDLDLFFLDTYDGVNEVEGCSCDGNCDCKNDCPNNVPGCGSNQASLSDAILPVGTIYV